MMWWHFGLHGRSANSKKTWSRWSDYVWVAPKLLETLNLRLVWQYVFVKLHFEQIFIQINLHRSDKNVGCDHFATNRRLAHRRQVFLTSESVAKSVLAPLRPVLLLVHQPATVLVSMTTPSQSWHVASFLRKLAMPLASFCQCHKMDFKHVVCLIRAGNITLLAVSESLFTILCIYLKRHTKKPLESGFSYVLHWVTDHRLRVLFPRQVQALCLPRSGEVRQRTVDLA